jgi:hypothetical protein
MINVICAVRRPLPIQFASQCTPIIPQPHTLMDHKYNSLSFSIKNSNSYSCMSQTFMLQGSHTGPTPVMPWGGSPAAGRPSTWLPPSPPAGYLPPPPPAGHPGHSSSTPPSPLGQGYWPPPWASPAGGQAPPWGMPPWITSTPQPQRPSSSPLTVRYLYLLSIVTFII